MFRTRLARVFLAAAVALTACSTSDNATPATVDGGFQDELIHVHDVLVGPGGTPVYLAAHTGLYELRDRDVLPRSDRFDDLMAAAIESDGTLIASGHPDLRTDDLRVEGTPPLLGLVESDDGATWTPRSLLGNADFHALVVAGDHIYGADSTSARVLVSTDGGHTWTPRTGEAQLLDLAVDPSDTDTMVGIDLDRGLVRSDDGATTWEPVPDAPALVDLEWTPAALVGLDADGSVHASDDSGQTWTAASTLQDVEALGNDGTSLYAFVPPAGLLRSDDSGQTWTAVIDS